MYQSFPALSMPPPGRARELGVFENKLPNAPRLGQTTIVDKSPWDTYVIEGIVCVLLLKSFR